LVFGLLLPVGEESFRSWTFGCITVVVCQLYTWSYGGGNFATPWLCALPKSAWLCEC